MANSIDMTGQQFGSLTVTSLSHKRNYVAYWECLCDCGTVKVIRGDHLRYGRVITCAGPAHRFLHPEDANTKHPLYATWCGMIKRCSVKHSDSYKYYGAKGISVCTRWRTFSNFVHDMGERPKGHTLNRIDNSKNYGPGNCVWSSKYDQANNKSSNIPVTIGDNTFPSLSTAARYYKISYDTIRNRHRKGDRGTYLVRPCK